MISHTFLLSLVLKENTCWRSHGAQMLRTWLPIRASCCRLAPSSASWTRWSVTWHQWVSCRWLHGRGPARRKTSWHPGKTCRNTQCVQELPSCNYYDAAKLLVICMWRKLCVLFLIVVHYRACRLKKKAQYEANKVKLWGLSTEYGMFLMQFSFLFIYLHRHSFRTAYMVLIFWRPPFVSK